MPARKGLAGACVATARPVSVADAYDDTRFSREFDKTSGFTTRSVLCMPVCTLSSGGSVVAVIQMINKHDGSTFNDQDERVMAVCCTKVAAALKDRLVELLAGEARVTEFQKPAVSI